MNKGEQATAATTTTTKETTTTTTKNRTTRQNINDQQYRRSFIFIIFLFSLLILLLAGVRLFPMLLLRAMQQHIRPFCWTSTFRAAHGGDVARTECRSAIACCTTRPVSQNQKKSMRVCFGYRHLQATMLLLATSSFQLVNCQFFSFFLTGRLLLL